MLTFMRTRVMAPWTIDWTLAASVSGRLAGDSDVPGSAVWPLTTPRWAKNASTLLLHDSGYRRFSRREVIEVS